jgi:hypothetical protein
MTPLIRTTVHLLGASTALALATWALWRGEATFIVFVVLAAACGAIWGARPEHGLPLPAHDDSELQHAGREVWRPGRFDEVDEVRAALEVAVLSGRPLVEGKPARTVEGEAADQFLKSDLRPELRRESGEPVAAPAGAEPAGEPHAHIRKGGQTLRLVHSRK